MPFLAYVSEQADDSSFPLKHWKLAAAKIKMVWVEAFAKVIAAVAAGPASFQPRRNLARFVGKGLKLRQDTNWRQAAPGNLLEANAKRRHRLYFRTSP